MVLYSLLDEQGEQIVAAAWSPVLAEFDHGAVEIIPRCGMVRLYTHDFVRRMGEGNWNLMPILCQ